MKFEISPSLTEFALGVGVLCQNWASIEHRCEMLFVHVAKLPDTAASYAMVRCITFRDLLSALKVGVVSTFTDHLCIDEIVETVDYIDNVLRPRRNRYVHDLWFPGVDGDPPVRSSYIPRIVRKQSHRPREIQWTDFAEQSLDDLSETISELRSHAWYLERLILTYRDIPTSVAGVIAEKPKRKFFI